MKTPQEILQEALEDFENLKQTYDDFGEDAPFVDFKEGKSLFVSTLRAFIEAEIARLEGIRKKWLEIPAVNEQGEGFQRGLNQAISDQISHLKELR